MTYPITSTFWLKIMFRHGNNKLTAFGTACVRTAFWPHLLCAGFNTTPINPHYHDRSFLPSSEFGSQVKISRAALGYIYIDSWVEEPSHLSWLYWKSIGEGGACVCVRACGGCYYGNKRDTATPGLQYNTVEHDAFTLPPCSLTPSAKRVNTGLVSQ